MKRKTAKKKRNKIYADSPFGRIKLGSAMRDLLPPPDEIAHMLRARKVTITLTEGCVDFFKRQSETHHVPYQAMMREVLSSYVRESQRV